MRIDEIEGRTGHRPWPLQDAPWVAFQSWHRTLFAHWPLPAAALRPHVPAPLHIEEYDGTAWLGLVPFRVRDSRPRGLPSFPPISDFDELNLRTYVRHGGYSGVWFFSLDASHALVAAAARSLLGLPYRHADMQVTEEGAHTWFSSHRRDGAALFSGDYAPATPAEWHEPRPGTLEHFLVERYCLFTVHDDTTRRLDIHHPPWRITRAAARIEQNTVASATGITLPAAPPLCHAAEPQHTLFWLPRTQNGSERGR